MSGYGVISEMPVHGFRETHSPFLNRVSDAEDLFLRHPLSGAMHGESFHDMYVVPEIFFRCAATHLASRDLHGL